LGARRFAVARTISQRPSIAARGTLYGCLHRVTPIAHSREIPLLAWAHARAIPRIAKDFSSLPQ
jgi:hypothetical protein